MLSMPEVLAFNLRRLRNKKRMTQEQLALGAGIDRSYLGTLERAEHSATVITIGKLAKALDELPSELLRLPPRPK